MIVPIHYKNLIEKRFDRSHNWWYIAFGFIIIIFSLMMGILMQKIIWEISIIVIILLVIIFYLFFWSDKKVNNSIHYLKFKLGKKELIKYQENIELLQMFLPIRALHPNGLIQDTGDRYFMLLKYVPLRLSDDTKEAMMANIEKIHSSLKDDDIIFSYFIVSRNEYDYTLEKNLMKAIQNAPKETKEHLLSLQEMISKDKNNIAWDFYIMFGIGHYNTPEEAEINRQSLFTGLLDLLKTTETTVFVLESPHDITYSYAKFLNPGV